MEKLALVSSSWNGTLRNLNLSQSYFVHIFVQWIDAYRHYFTGIWSYISAYDKKKSWIYVTIELRFLTNFIFSIMLFFLPCISLVRYFQGLVKNFTYIFHILPTCYSSQESVSGTCQLDFSEAKENFRGKILIFTCHRPTFLDGLDYM